MATQKPITTGKVTTVWNDLKCHTVPAGTETGVNVIRLYTKGVF